MKTLTAVPVAFDDVGEGEAALVMLPGWCSNRTVFRPLLAPAGRHRRVLALDWRGHGGSERPRGDFGTAELVDDVVGVLDVAGVERVVPVALSHAGWVAIELRRRLGPERVPGLVLLDWMVLGAPPPFYDALAGLQDPDSFQAVRSALFAMWTEGVTIPELDSHVGEMAEYHFPMWARAGRAISAAFAEAGSPVAVLERLEPPPPTLHVYAQPADRAFLEGQRQYASGHEWFRVHRLEARSHFPMFEVPAEMADAIERFVAGL